MRLMMIVKSNERSEAGVLPSEKELAAMGAYNEELIKAGLLLAMEGLQPSSMGTRVRISGGKTSVIDGPFAEAKELVAGYWVVKVNSKAEAIDWAKRVPFKEGAVELRPLYEAEDFVLEGSQAPDPSLQTPPPPARKPGTHRFALLLKVDAYTEAGGPPNEKLVTEMGALIQELVSKQALLDGEGLKPTSQGARVLYSGDERTVVDGPFTETKELVAGWSVVQFATKAEAVEYGRRMLQIHMDGVGSTSGELEVRQIFEIEDFPLDAAEKPEGWRALETAFRDRV
jgi:hypothetical protein